MCTSEGMGFCPDLPRVAVQVPVEAGETMSDAEVLAAFRTVTGWLDELVLHYATCPDCIVSDVAYDCPVSPPRIAIAAYHAERLRAQLPAGGDDG